MQTLLSLDGIVFDFIDILTITISSPNLLYQNLEAYLTPFTHRGSFLKPVDNLPPGRAIVVAARKVRLTQDARGGRGESHEGEAAKDCPKIVRVSHSCLILYAQKYVVEVS